VGAKAISHNPASLAALSNSHLINQYRWSEPRGQGRDPQEPLNHCFLTLYQSRSAACWCNLARRLVHGVERGRWRLPALRETSHRERARWELALPVYNHFIEMT